MDKVATDGNANASPGSRWNGSGSTLSTTTGSRPNSPVASGNASGWPRAVLHPSYHLRREPVPPWTCRSRHRYSICSKTCSTRLSALTDPFIAHDLSVTQSANWVAVMYRGTTRKDRGNGRRADRGAHPWTYALSVALSAADPRAASASGSSGRLRAVSGQPPSGLDPTCAAPRPRALHTRRTSARGEIRRSGHPPHTVAPPGRDGRRPPRGERAARPRRPSSAHQGNVRGHRHEPDRVQTVGVSVEQVSARSSRAGARGSSHGGGRVGEGGDRVRHRHRATLRAGPVRAPIADVTGTRRRAVLRHWGHRAGSCCRSGSQLRLGPRIRPVTSPSASSRRARLTARRLELDRVPRWWLERSSAVRR